MLPPPSRNCDEIRSLLSVVADHEATADEAARVEVHIAGCARCASELAFMRTVHAALSRPLEAIPPAALHARIAAATYARPTILARLSRLLQPAPAARLALAGSALAAGVVAVAVLSRGPSIPAPAPAASSSSPASAGSSVSPAPPTVAAEKTTPGGGGGVSAPASAAATAGAPRVAAAAAKPQDPGRGAAAAAGTARTSSSSSLVERSRVAVAAAPATGAAVGADPAAPDTRRQGVLVAEAKTPAGGGRLVSLRPSSGVKKTNGGPGGGGARAATAPPWSIAAGGSAARPRPHDTLPAEEPAGSQVAVAPAAPAPAPQPAAEPANPGATAAASAASAATFVASTVVGTKAADGTIRLPSSGPVYAQVAFKGETAAEMGRSAAMNRASSDYSFAGGSRAAANVVEAPVSGLTK